MHNVTDPVAWGDAMDQARTGGSTVGLVPTMGALHPGHLSLIRRARADCATVAVTNFVNPLQFSPTEDLAAYPRDPERDAALAAGVGADIMFAPSVEAMWPRPTATAVHVAGLTDRFEGEARPTHFDGVTTVVAKLFSLAGRCYAYFGEKDFQQLAVVRRMVEDLSLPVFVIGCPTVRTPDGLALSSRNAYLTPEEIAVAPCLYWALLAGRRAVEDARVTDPAEVIDTVAASLATQPRFSLEYVGLVDPETFETPERLAGPVRLLAAARLGAARLIDNVPAGSAA